MDAQTAILAMAFLGLGIAAYLGMAYLVWGGVFKKMGLKWWYCLIPIYSEYRLYKKIDVPVYLIIINIVVINVFGNIINYNAMSGLDIMANNYYTVYATRLFTNPLYVFTLVFSCYMFIYVRYKLSKAFNKGVGYTIFIIFLPIIALPILGFGNSKYILNK